MAKKNKDLNDEITGSFHSDELQKTIFEVKEPHSYKKDDEYSKINF